MVGGKGDAGSGIKLVQESVGDAASIRPDVDQLIAATSADGGDEKTDPIGEHLLREQAVIESADLLRIAGAVLGKGCSCQSGLEERIGDLSSTENTKRLTGEKRISQYSRANGRRHNLI
jgi:hypothetical protein